MTAEQIAAASKCFTCFDETQSSSAVVALLASIYAIETGTTLTTEQIVSNSKCFCVPDPIAADVYLLSILVL